jgi:hypothetical protein
MSREPKKDKIVLLQGHAKVFSGVEHRRKRKKR